jgi:hypothetical protein
MTMGLILMIPDATNSPQTSWKSSEIDRSSTMSLGYPQVTQTNWA